MATLVFREEPHEYDSLHADEIERIVEVCRNAGFDISPRDARRAWEANSESSAANWLSLPDEDEYIVLAVRRYCEER